MVSDKIQLSATPPPPRSKGALFLIVLRDLTISTSCRRQTAAGNPSIKLPREKIRLKARHSRTGLRFIVEYGSLARHSSASTRSACLIPRASSVVEFILPFREKSFHFPRE